jgi:hypothetical protein
MADLFWQNYQKQNYSSFSTQWFYLGEKFIHQDNAAVRVKPISERELWATG